VRTDLYTPDKEYLFENAERLSGERQGALDAFSMAEGRGKCRNRKRRAAPATVENASPERLERERNQNMERTL
jgi:hypothetical protein